MMKSPVGSVLLAACTIVGWPAAAVPWNTLSTKPGPYSLLKIWTQAVPHCVVDAPAGSAAAVQRPPTTVSAAAVASTLLLMDMTVPFLGTAVPGARRWCAGQWDERGPGQVAGRPGLRAAASPSRYGAKNAVSAVSVASGASSA